MRDVAVMVANAVQFYSVEPLLNAMDQFFLKYDIILPDWDTPEYKEEGWIDIQKDLENLLEEEDIPYLKAPVKASYRVCMSPYSLLGEVEAVFRISYGYGYVTKAGFSTAPENKMNYDYILCHGDLDAEFFSAYAKTCIVGEPKLLDYKKRNNLHEKLRILYLPTYGELSSIQDAVPVLKTLSDKYEISAKAHHGTNFLANEKNNLGVLSQSFAKIYDSKTPLYDLLAEADVVLSDNSGAICDALATNTPVARFSVSDPDTIEGFVAPYLEFVENGILPSTNDPTEIENVLKEAMTDAVKELQSKAAEKLYFDPQEGKNNFIELIKRLLNVKKNSRLFFLQQKKNKYREKQILETESLLEENKRMSTEYADIKEKYICIQDSYENLLQNHAVSQEKLQELTEQNKIVQQKIKETENQNEALQKQLAEQSEIAQQKIQKLENKNAVLQKRLQESEEENDEKNAIIQRQSSAITQALQFCRQMLTAPAFKLMHLWGRIKKQFIVGSLSEKKKFISWLLHRSSTVTDGDHRFLPLFSVLDTLQPIADMESENAAISNCGYELIHGVPRGSEVVGSPLFQHLQNQIRYFKREELQPIQEQEVQLSQIIQKGNYRGILVYPYVVHWEPLQTPQQILRAFAGEGWLCLFCDDPEKCSDIIEIEKNLYLTTEKDVIQSTTNTQVTVLLTWMGSLAFVDRLSNKKIWYHVLDQLNIFYLYDNFYEILHAEMIKEADWVSYVASPLQECVKEREDALYLPNGCFYSEVNGKEMPVPDDLKPIVETGHKIIGYFGYMAEWMDCKMIKEAALARPNYEFVFIGDAIADISDLLPIPNVHFLGLKKYSELPAYASNFHVATIPFLRNSMMDCVSPIKFYEYCAYGKPVVSSRMKELEKYECDFIACIDTPAGFLEKIDLFTTPEIMKLAKEKAPLIAKKNSWSARAQTMEALFDASHLFALCAEKDFKIGNFNFEDHAVLNIFSNLQKHITGKRVVVIPPTIDWNMPMFQRPQQLACAYAKKNNTVAVYLTTNIKYDSVKIGREARSGLWVVNAAYTDLLSFVLNKASEVILSVLWPINGVYAEKFESAKIIYEYIDDISIFGDHDPAMQKLHEDMLRKADLTVCTADHLYDQISVMAKKAIISPNGGDYELFKTTPKAIAPNDLVRLTKSYRCVLGYYGALASWFDYDLIKEVAQKHSDWLWLLAGVNYDNSLSEAKIDRYSNIVCMDALPYSSLPGFLNLFDIATIPFRINEITKSTSPVKLFEYMAGGKPILTSDMPECRKYESVFRYQTADEFCQRVEEILSLKPEDRYWDILKQEASENTWEARTDEILCALDHTDH